MSTPLTVDKIAEYIRLLKACQDVQAISNVHELLPTREKRSLVEVYLWRFKQLSQDVQNANEEITTQQQRKAILHIEERLTVLTHELYFRHTADDQEFYAISNQWLEIISNHLQAIEQGITALFSIENPYVFGMPLSSRQNIFVGRKELSLRIRQVLIDQVQLPALLYGQRRMGKTSLLKNLGRMMPNDVIFLFIDGQGIAVARDYSGLLYNISREITKSAKNKKLNFPKLSRKDLETDPFSYFNEWLDDVEDKLIETGFQKAVIALDEFEALDYVMEKGRFDEEDMFYMLRYLIQNRERFEVLLAGSHTFDELPRWATHLVNVKMIKIGYLKKEDAHELIEHPIRNFPLHYQPEATERILGLTRGHPHLIQLLCHELVTLKNGQPAEQRQTATLADVEATIPEALDKGSFFFIDIQENQIDAKGLKILTYIAKQGEGATVSQETLEEQLGQESILSSLKLLFHRDILEAVHDEYRFQVEFIRRWFARLDI